MPLASLLADLNTELTPYLVDENSMVINPAGEITVEIIAQYLLPVCLLLKNHDKFKFNALMDLCGVDYLTYGLSEWVTDKATGTGFDRAVMNTAQSTAENADTRRFSVVYHLLSYAYNQRIRLKVYLDSQSLIIPSVSAIWPCAEWYEREAFDLYGILFEQHPDLRRILTDYGFIGHPFRKDFPLSGHVEVHYDEKQKRVIYAPVAIVPRILVPKVIREKPEKPQNMSN